MTRAELYSLVWDEPMVHIARRLGMSNIALRKLCEDHDIPTPPAGYWTKLAHGKPADRPPLPANRSSLLDQINLTFRRIVDVSNRLADNQIANFTLPHLFEEGEPPKFSPPHALAEAVGKALRKQRTDGEGFVHCMEPALPRVRVGQASVKRAVKLIDAFVKTLLQRGLSITASDDGLRVVADGEVFAFTLYETRQRQPRGKASPHQRAPSGQFCLEVSDPRPLRWHRRNLVGRWYDRDGQTVEQCLGDVASALGGAASAVKLVRADQKAQADAREMAAEQQVRDEAEQMRRDAQLAFAMAKARDYADFVALQNFARHLESQSRAGDSAPVDHLSQALNRLLDDKRRSFGRDALNAEIAKLDLFADDPSTGNPAS